MFEISDFIVTNTVNGVKNGTFTKEYANIMAVNYMLKGVLTEKNVISINSQIEEWENNAVADVVPGEIPVEDILGDEQESTEAKETTGEDSGEEPETEE